MSEPTTNAFIIGASKIKLKTSGNVLHTTNLRDQDGVFAGLVSTPHTGAKIFRGSLVQMH